MVITDPIADILVRIKNGGHAGKTVIYVPFSDMKLRLSNVLLKEGYVTSVVRKLKKGKRDERLIEIGIAYDAPRVPRVRGMERVSRPSRRVYIGSKEIRPVLQGHGLMILSTPKGLLTDTEARKEHVGGEVICKIW
ncbi:MAG: 30S ribosomal protein S8 [Candidatus Lloydbacteria bacterium RIFOXYC12_FULL_46_25]|uniref:Small ribosomal subunit protein uS8 n=1 Tax=Candidatus Lloydbacteria bacterium RIFOXYC12_FULL_46_25 TaxID=1798670 RepID=A0A1G2DU04_9BACT|nr:MAG: 30S ribosomal protein S8 [Candidatus Lloydbacteria bacterium RIFOXYC12_FULL_46_25]